MRKLYLLVSHFWYYRLDIGYISKNKIDSRVDVNKVVELSAFKSLTNTSLDTKPATRPHLGIALTHSVSNPVATKIYNFA